MAGRLACLPLLSLTSLNTSSGQVKCQHGGGQQDDGAGDGGGENKYVAFSENVVEAGDDGGENDDKASYGGGENDDEASDGC